MQPWIFPVLSVGAFVLFAVLLAFVRVRSEGRFTVETREITAAVVAVAIGLLLFGELDEIAFGDLRIARKISEEADKSVVDRIAFSPTTVKYERAGAAARKSRFGVRSHILTSAVLASNFFTARLTVM